MAVATNVNTRFLTKFPGPIGYIQVEQDITRVVSGFDQKGYINLDARVPFWNLYYYATQTATAPAGGGAALTLYPEAAGASENVSTVSSAVNYYATNAQILYGITPSAGAGGASVVAIADVGLPIVVNFQGGIQGLYWKITGVTGTADAIVVRHIRVAGSVGR